MVLNELQAPLKENTDVGDLRDAVTVKRNKTSGIPNNISYTTVQEDISLLSQYSVGEDLMRKGLLIPVKTDQSPFG
jgi:hypothetical protein